MLIAQTAEKVAKSLFERSNDRKKRKEPWHFLTFMTVENSLRRQTFYWSTFWSSLDWFNIGMKYSISDTDLLLKEALFSNLY
jgi:hypothetical protein